MNRISCKNKTKIKNLIYSDTAPIKSYIFGKFSLNIMKLFFHVNINKVMNRITRLLSLF